MDCSFTKKACKFVINTQRDSSTETFLGVTKGGVPSTRKLFWELPKDRVPSARKLFWELPKEECLQQNIFDRPRLLDFDSERSEKV